MTRDAEHAPPGLIDEALASVKGLFDTLFANSGDTIFFTDTLRIVDCNPATLAMFGCHDKQEVVGQSLLRFSPARQPDARDSAEMAGRYMAAALDGTPQHFEWRACQLDGNTALDVDVKLNRVCLGCVPFVLAVVRDVTAHKQAERALAASVRHLRGLFDATNDALIVYDETGRVLAGNERAGAMFNVDVGEFCHLSIGEMSLGESPYSETDGQEKIQRAFREGPQVFEWQSRRRDGTLFWTEVALRAFGTNHERRVMASVRDITERKRAAREREQLLAVQAAKAAKDEFLAMLSHELRNPLTTIHSCVELLRETAPCKEPDISRALDIIERNVGLQVRLVEDLFDLARLERGKLTICRVPVRLEEAVLSAVEACRASANRADVVLEARTDTELWTNADQDRVQQVVSNLIGNGIKFTPPGGRVSVLATSKGERVRIIVEDTGMGIEAERLPHLFELFQQGPVPALHTPGLGVGLALVKSLVELHEGQVWAESEGPGRGSRFIVELRRIPSP
jgi:two-component system CheB/CheR fusion protein